MGQSFQNKRDLSGPSPGDRKQQGSVSWRLSVLTLLIALFGLVLPSDLIEPYLIPVGCFLIILGIPHGAGDLRIFREVVKGNHDVKQILLRFGFFYLLTSGLFVLLWFYVPVYALLLFLLVSAFHFGQSHWHEREFRSSFERAGTMITWGIALLGLPILLYWDQSVVIIREITGQGLTISDWRYPLIFLLVMSNLVNLARLRDRQVIDGQEFKEESFAFLSLTALFFCTPLLIGFAVYFVLWHSSVAMRDQLVFFRRGGERYNQKKYLREVIGLTMLALVLLASAYRILGDTLNQGLNLGVLFLFIAVITMPHSLLMNQLYEQLRELK